MATNGQTEKKSPASTAARPALPALSLRDAINRLFDEFGVAAGPFRFPAMFDVPADLAAGFNPKIDVKESETDITVSAEIPGVDAKDINVNLVGDKLVIHGEKKSEYEETAGGIHRVERSYGSFQRAIMLPAEVQSDKVEASYKDGVLKVTLPKSAKAVENSKKIEVKTDK